MAAILPFPTQPEVRLRTALRGLEAALAEQQSALAEFRSELGGLRDSLAGLEGSVVAYQGNLARLSEGAEGAAQEARRLERTAEAWRKA